MVEDDSGKTSFTLFRNQVEQLIGVPIEKVVNEIGQVQTQTLLYGWTYDDICVLKSSLKILTRYKSTFPGQNYRWNTTCYKEHDREALPLWTQGQILQQAWPWWLHSYEAFWAALGHPNICFSVKRRCSPIQETASGLGGETFTSSKSQTFPLWNK